MVDGVSDQNPLSQDYEQRWQALDMDEDSKARFVLKCLAEAQLARTAESVAHFVEGAIGEISVEEVEEILEPWKDGMNRTDSSDEDYDSLALQEDLKTFVQGKTTADNVALRDSEMDFFENI